MQKWEYTLVYMRTFAEMRRELTRLGEEGWELVAVHEGVFFFKRPKS